jgi:hypothetical protein
MNMENAERVRPVLLKNLLVEAAMPACSRPPKTRLFRKIIVAADSGRQHHHPVYEKQLLSVDIDRALP